MRCSKCRKEAIVFQPYSGQHLCQDHFVLDFETKAKRAIRQNQWMRPGDHIAVALTGTAADEALLAFFKKLAGRRNDIRVSGIRVAGTRADLPAMAREMGATKIALATPLEDVSAGVLLDILRGDVEKYFTPSPMPGGDLPRITPFCHIPAGEIASYARLSGFLAESPSSPQDNDSLGADIKVMLADYSHRHPATPHAVLNLCDSLKKTVCYDEGHSAKPDNHGGGNTRTGHRTVDEVRPSTPKRTNL